LSAKTPNLKLAAVCGLFCPACTFYIATSEDQERLRKLAERFQLPTEELECHGCRSDKQAYYCRKHCKMTKCSKDKDINFCGECPEYPCVELKDFQSQHPHRLDLWENQQRIKSTGYEKWYLEMVERFSCPKCHTLNSAYDVSCRRCGSTPSCDFVSEYIDVIIEKSGKLRL
jgi:hypothetical protein